MKKSLISAIVVVSALLPVSAAFAYQLPSPINTSTHFAGGSGEVDLSLPSSVQGTVSVDTTDGENAWVTAGDVAGGQPGYGYFIHDDMLFGVTHTGYLQYLLPLGFVHPNTVVSVKATYTPNDGVRFDTASNSIGWNQYSRGILKDLPNSAIRGLGAFNVSVTSKNNPSNIFVGSWSYGK